MKIFALERRGILAILQFLIQSEQEEWKLTDLFRHIPCSQKALYASLRRLLELGLMADRWEQKPFRTRYLRLTKEGRAIAAHVEEISRLLETAADAPAHDSSDT